MSRTVLLLHSALGLRPAVGRFADELRTHGHRVVVPDFYDGRVFDENGPGLAYRDAVGGRELLARLTPVLDDLPDDAALAGFSLGAAFAQHLAARRPQACALILLHSVSAPRGDWPGVPVQIHRYAHDPFVAEDDLDRLRAAVLAGGARFEDHVTPGDGHLFTDSDLPDHDAAATRATISRVLALLDD